MNRVCCCCRFDMAGRRGIEDQQATNCVSVQISGRVVHCEIPVDSRTFEFGLGDAGLGDPRTDVMFA